MPDRLIKISKLNFILPIMLVLMIASMLVFIKVLPDMPDIVDSTEEFREDREAIIEAPPLPDSDTTSVGIIDPKIIEPGPDTRGDENVTGEDIEPSSGARTLAGILDALIFVAIAVVGGFFIYLLFKFRKKMTLKAMFSSLLAVVTIATCIFFGFMAYRIVELKTDPALGDYQVLAIMLLFSIPIGVLVTRSMFARSTTIKARNYGLLITGALMGSFMAALLPLYGVIPLVIAISLFDIYSVRRGPINKIMKLADEEYKEKREKRKEKSEMSRSELEMAADKDGDKREEETAGMTVNRASMRSSELSKEEQIVARFNAKKLSEFDDEDADLMLMYETPRWSIGVGDFVIYSMFAAFVLTHTMQYMPYYGFYTPVLGFIVPWVVFLVTTIGLLGGFVFTLRMLSKKSLMPGLPLAIFMGLALFFIQLLVMQVFNFLAYGKFVPIV